MNCFCFRIVFITQWECIVKVANQDFTGTQLGGPQGICTDIKLIKKR